MRLETVKYTNNEYYRQLELQELQAQIELLYDIKNQTQAIHLDEE